MLPEKADEPQDVGEKEIPPKEKSTSTFYQGPMTREKVREINRRRSIMRDGHPGYDYPWSWHEY